MTLLEIERLDQFHGDFQALFDVTMHVDEGEVVAIIGANGAGKSTLLKTVAGLLRAPANALRFDGIALGARPTHERVALGIALVPEGRRIFASLTVKENLLVGAYGRRRGRWDLERVFEVFPHLARLSGRVGAVLSGGEQQAVAIGRALMANPRLVLMDELSLGLAPIVVKSLYEAVPAIVADGTTLVVVEQDVSQALRVAQRAYCLLEGRVSLQGRPAELTRERVRAAYFGI
jgi:branched-chain amino acid transport system ATP-binding protein